MSDWISVDEGLPERNKPVFLLYSFAGDVVVLDGWLYVTDRIQPMWKVVQAGHVVATEDNVTHWQPKTYPKPPGVEQKICKSCQHWDLVGIGYSDGYRQCKAAIAGTRTAPDVTCDKWKAKEQNTCSTCALWSPTSQKSGRCPHSFYCHRLCTCEDWKAKEPEQKKTCKTCQYWHSGNGGDCENYGEPAGVNGGTCCDDWTAKEVESKKQTCETCAFWDFNGPGYSCGCRQCKIDSDIKAPDEAACGAWKEKTPQIEIRYMGEKVPYCQADNGNFVFSIFPKDYEGFEQAMSRALRKELRRC